MRKRLIVPVILGLITALSGAAGALAAENVLITASVSPQTLSGAGEVTLRVTVANSYNAPYSMEDVLVLRGEATLCRMGDIVPADSRTRQAALPVAAEELGREIVLTLSWSENGAAQTQDFSVTVGGDGARPEVEFTRSLPVRVARTGDDVLITYAVRNTGVIDVTDLTITDGQAGTVGSRGVLAAGGDAWETVVSHRMDGDFTSAPTLTYTAGSSVYSTALDPVTVETAVTSLSAALEVDQTHVTAGTAVTLMCTVTNTGNTDLATVTVSCGTMGQLDTITNLAAGASRVFIRQITASETASYFFTVAGRDGAGGTAETATNPVTVTALETPSEISMSIEAWADRRELERAGDVRIELAIANTGTAPLTNVQVIDQDGLIIGTFDTLPVGRQTINHTAHVGADKVFLFKMSLLMDDGTVREVASQPIEVTVREPDPTPASTGITVVTGVTADPGTTAPASGGSGLTPVSAELRAILAAIALIAAAIAVLVALMVRDRERGRAGRSRRRR